VPTNTIGSEIKNTPQWYDNEKNLGEAVSDDEALPTRL
jgi:hypothetical protein